jgi:hypothetical protein
MPNQESYTGADLTGVDGATNRVLTLANTSLSIDPVMIFVDNQIIAISDLTIVHKVASSTVQFLIPIYNTQVIRVIYYLTGYALSGTFYYTDIAKVYAKTGLSITEVDFTSGSNADLIYEAEAELEAVTGKKWTNANSITEYFDGQNKDILGTSGQYSRMIVLRNYPIQSITSLQILNSDQSVNKSYAALSAASITAGTYYTVDYTLDTSTDNITNTIIPSGRINLISDIFPTGVKNIKVVYTYGYSTVPILIQNLASCMVGIRAWVRFAGGSYNFINSYSIPQQSVNKGDIYERAEKNVLRLTDEANRILDQVGRRQSKVFFASGSGSDR